jgi:hypothetical protein
MRSRKALRTCGAYSTTSTKGGLTDAPFFLDNGTQKRSSGHQKGENHEATEATALSATMSDTGNTPGGETSDEALLMNGEAKSTEALAVTPIGSEELPMTEKKSDDEGTATKDTTTTSAVSAGGGTCIEPAATEQPTESTTTANPSGETDDALAPSKAPSEEDFVDEDDVDKEEEALFCTLEMEKEKEDLEEALHLEDKPKAAPALIQAGIKAGEVQDEDDDAVKSGDAKEEEKEKAGVVQVSILYYCLSLLYTILLCLFII